MDSTYNLGGLIARVKTRLDDQSYNEDTITQFLNDAYLETLGEAHYQFLEKSYRSAAQKAGVLPLPRNFQSCANFTAKLNKNLWRFHYMPYEEFLSLPKEGGLKDFKYTIFGDQLFFCVPNIEHNLTEDGEEQFYNLTLYYLAKPTMLVNATDKPLLPYEYGEILVLGALARCERLRDNFDYAAIYENKRDELITNLKMRYCPRNLDNANRGRLPVRVSLER